MTSFSFFKYFDAIELDANVVNFVYYGKTRLCVLMPKNMLEGIKFKLLCSRMCQVCGNPESQNVERWREPINAILSFYDYRWNDGDTQTLTAVI